ncbi:hypothetical protein [Streptomyces sp. CB01881]|uniref:hypothetical protein n=1 Tax=Streptomyces sp. CB01881 TaxID=2078691 RepID=UPI000CDBB09D|nr:hypothetical protein [Streptomyces sp. CB01881]AUY53540.1 hypothetical protein C2142_37075 [Streptomyces sp. CB01881]TYC69686.1 hypothetical protein EH183_37105 [Streptomyces sp. CB01881]
MTSDERTIPAVGVRPLDEVFDAIESAHRRPQPWTGFDHGVLGAYRWAAGAQGEAPVTTAAALGAMGPCRAQLLAECQAAAVRLRDALNERTDPAYALGAYQALAWLCGHHEDRP